MEAKTAFVKLQRKHSLGVTRSLEVTGKYTTREEAEASAEPGIVYPVIQANKMLKDFNSRNNS